MQVDRTQEAVEGKTTVGTRLSTQKDSLRMGSKDLLFWELGKVLVDHLEGASEDSI